MRYGYLLLVLFLVPTLHGQQWPMDAAQHGTVLGNNKAEATAAMKSGKLVLSSTESEYVLAPGKEAMSAARNQFIWSFGDKALRSDESVKVKIQIGEYAGKRVFLPLAVPKAGGQAAVDDALKVVDEAISETAALAAHPGVKPCRGKARCVKWCKDEKGKQFCCSYECGSGLHENE